MLATLFLGGTAIAIDLPPYTNAALAAAAPAPFNPEPDQSHPVLAGIPNLFTKEWWMYLAGIKPAPSAAAAAASQLEIFAPSIDEEDAEWYLTGTTNATDDPATFTATLVGQSRYGLKMTIEQGGSGYGSAPAVTITGADGGGWAAGATATIAAGVLVDVSRPTSWYGLVAPLIVTLTGGGPAQAAVVTAKLGRQFAEGDLGVWNDPTIVGQARSYEIAQITGIAPIDATHATITLQRAAPGAAVGDGSAFLGSMKAAHAGAAFYRLQNDRFLRPFSLAAGPQDIFVSRDSMTIPAVQLTLPGQAPAIINLAKRVYLPGTATPDPRTNPPAPGVRTMNFAAYTDLGIPGGLVVGATAANRVPIQARAGIRCFYARVLTAPTGATAFHGDANACIVVYVCFLAPPDLSGVRAVGLIETLVIDAGMFTSYIDTSSVTPAPNVPDGRQMPFHPYWPATAPNVDWPTTRFPSCTALVAGKLVLPFVVNPAITVPMVPDGEIDFIVAQAGTVINGADLSVVGQT